VVGVCVFTTKIRFSYFFTKHLKTLFCRNAPALMVKVRLTEKKIQEVVRSVCGADVLPLVKKLKGKENISEFKLADQLKADIKRVRNTLYRLYGANLVQFTRKKDKKKGWYIYYWTFKPEQIRFLYKRLKVEELDMLHEKIQTESNEQHFVCVNKCVRMDFEQAINFEYRCPECGELTMQEGKEKRLESIKKRIIELEKEVKKIG
jgi:transcription initiation factor TFIIE subunit alpha